MSESINPSTLQEFDMADHLDTPEAMAAYLTVVMEEGEDASVADALRTMARARTEPDALALVVDLDAITQAGNSLRLESLLRACAMLGLKLVAEPV